ncbi:MAG: nitrile hydratase subunit alpha [Holophagales bacterium]|nr:nitrile hydratase subunit alpha [Holophagales bacterium]
MQKCPTPAESPWAEASRLQEAKRDLGVWASSWSRVRARLLEMPRRVLELELGHALGPDVSVTVHEERDDLRFLVLPDWPAESPAAELDPETVYTLARQVLPSRSPVDAREAVSGRAENRGEVGEDPELTIVARAWGDSAFRRQLREQPTATLGHALGIAWPEEVEMRLLEETREELHIVIPSRVDEPAEALLDEHDLDSLELPLVAGSPTVILSVSILCD